jgi:photosystem II stability/assembly factor-like uncharacterized protein
LKTGTLYANTCSGRTVQYETGQAMKSDGCVWRQAGAGLAFMAAGVAACLAAGQGPAAASPPTQAPPLLLSIASAGHVVLAAGDRGAMLRSKDDGAHFTPVPVPSRATLTRVVMQDDGIAFAVGFDATILRSTDSGAHWARVLNDERGDNPLFGLVTSLGGAALAVGGFGHAYTSPNGIDWQPTHVLSEDDDFHLNAALAIDSGKWLLVGEQALVMRSDDAGAHWRKLAVPVQGSLFGGVVLSPQRWIIFGLRGHAVSTDDAGAHWQVINTGTTAELLGGTALHDGRVLLVGNRGTVVLIDAAAHTGLPLKRDGRENFADCLQLPDGSVLAAGESGLTKIDVPDPGPQPVPNTAVAP